MTRLLLAPAGHGKTQFVIEHIRQVLAAEILARVTVIVPNMIQTANFRNRMAEAGGTLGVEVHTFHTLYAELLTRAGAPIALLLDPVRIRLLQFIVDELCEQGKMQHYAALRDKPGFISILRNNLEELKRARIFPNDFASATNGLGARLEEIALVYSEYQDWLQKQNWADNEGRGWLGTIALESDPNLMADTRLLIVTGFDEFNPTQMSVLSLLAHRAKETIITLTGDMQHPQRIAHHRFQRAQETLQSSLNIQPEAMESSSMLSQSIANIESSLFENRKSEIVNPKSRIEFIEAQTRAIEARAALRWIKARIVRNGLKLTDVAILARDLEPYRAFLEETAAEFGIPLRFVSGQPLAENPAVAALLSLLSLPAAGDWRRRALLEAWRSPYFDWAEYGITSTEAALLDEISRQTRVSQGLAQWRESFEVWEKRKEFSDKESDGDISHSEDTTQKARAAFESFVDLLTPPSQAVTRDFTAFIESLIGDDPALLTAFSSQENDGLNLITCARANPATAERDVAALRAFKDVLRGLVLAESALGADSMPYADFYNDLRRAVESATYSIPSQAGVLCASVLDARGLSFEAIVLMGLSDGEFPRLEREDILLRESDRAILRERGLPLETRLHGDEGTLFYQAITRARQKLLLTRPYLAQDGQTWDASPFWSEIMRLNGSSSTVRVRPEDWGQDSAEAASQVEWVESAREFDIHIKNGIEVLKARTAKHTKAGEFYKGGMFDLSERFGAAHGWSASRLESYGTCPFEFFIAYALEFEPRTPTEEGFDVRALGSMLHKILEDVYGTHDPINNLSESARKIFATAPQDYGFRPTPLWDLQQKELIRTLEKSMRALDEVSQGYAPIHLEAKFGMGNPSLILNTSAGEIRLHGYIDRLDAAPDGSLRVIDYKAGSTAISANHLKEGRRLQLPIYALAARDALGLGKISSGFYWHIQKAEASSIKLEKYEGGVEGAFDAAVAHIGEHVTNIRAGCFEPKPPDDGCPSYCPAVGFCWRYKI